jgi:hypothetical protein
MLLLMINVFYEFSYVFYLIFWIFYLIFCVSFYVNLLFLNRRVATPYIMSLVSK